MGAAGGGFDLVLQVDAGSLEVSETRRAPKCRRLLRGGGAADDEPRAAELRAVTAAHEVVLASLVIVDLRRLRLFTALPLR